MKKLAFLVLAAGLSLSAVLPGLSQTSVKDDQGYDFPLGKAPRRIVSLAPNVTEVLFELGLGPEIVGVTRYCDFPPAALTKEKIGGLVDPDLERIRALDPDLIIAFRGNPLPVVQRMRSLRLPVFVLEMGRTLDSVFPFLDKIGRVTQRDKEAQALIQGLRNRYSALQTALRREARKPRLFIALHGLGLWTCGEESYLTDLADKAGGTNIAGRFPRRWLNCSREQIVQDNPEVFVVLVKSAEDFEPAKRWLMDQPYLASLTAVRSGCIYPLDENKTSRYGPRLFDALEELARQLHPGCFARKPTSGPEAAGPPAKTRN